MIGRNKAGERKLPDGSTIAYEESESYPGDELFGQKGWYYMEPQRQEAERRFRSLG